MRDAEVLPNSIKTSPLTPPLLYNLCATNRLTVCFWKMWHCCWTSVTSSKLLPEIIQQSCHDFPLITKILWTKPHSALFKYCQWLVFPPWLTVCYYSCIHILIYSILRLVHFHILTACRAIFAHWRVAAGLLQTTEMLFYCWTIWFPAKQCDHNDDWNIGVSSLDATDAYMRMSHKNRIDYHELWY